MFAVPSSMSKEPVLFKMFLFSQGTLITNETFASRTAVVCSLLCLFCFLLEGM